MNTDKLAESLSTLNKPQHAAVTCPNGPTLVVAGAGSGKTRVLTMRIAFLLTQGVKPYNIMALTFTNKAATEMKERIAQIVGQQTAQQLWMGTFHSVFSRILHVEHELINMPSDFSIYDTEDSKSLISNIIKKQFQLDDKAYPPSLIQKIISDAKNDMVMPLDYEHDESRTSHDADANRPRTAEIYRTYCNECAKANAMDFDDLLLKINLLFRQHPMVLEKYQNKFQYILVDEYQDTNRVQYCIINQLAASHHNICVVGDDAQSIYSFRGARIENILNFQKDYPECQTFKLEQNYRSTRNIVGAANRLIANNTEQIPKNVFSEGDVGDKIQVWACKSDRGEASKVVGNIATRISLENKRPSDFAILYRNNAQSRTFEEELRQMSLPYRVYGGTAFYQRKEIKNVLAYLRLIVNPNDVESLRRVINLPKRQIGDTSVDRILKFAFDNQTTMWEVMSNAKLLAQTGLNKPTQSRVLNFVALINTLAMESKQLDIYNITVETLSQSGLLKELNDQKKTEEGRDQYANVQSLLNGMSDYVDERREMGMECTLGEYMQEITLLTDADEDDKQDKVTLMTIHSSKGLEFDTVYIVGVEEEMFPSQRCILQPKGLEEERRLMYVAMTRAKRNLNISYAEYRFVWTESKATRPSRFIAELDNEFCNIPQKAQGAALDFGVSGNSSSSRFAKRGYQQARRMGSQGSAYGKPYALQRGQSGGYGKKYDQNYGANMGYGQGFGQGYGANRGGYGNRNKGWQETDIDDFGERGSANGFDIYTDINDIAARTVRQSPAPKFTPMAPPSNTVKVGTSQPTDAPLEKVNETPDKKYHVGQRISHDLFGLGTIEEITGTKMEDVKFRIKFDTRGEKTLLLRFARITAVEE